MQSGRQKKKFSQQKKRHHDYIKAKGGAAGPANSSTKETSKKDKAVNENHQDPTVKAVVGKVILAIQLQLGSKLQ